MNQQQYEIMQKFYEKPATKVVFNKKQRNELWKLAIKKEKEKIKKYNLKTKCPALENEIQKSYASGNNIQSAVFSECVYAQTLANMFNLTMFKNCKDSTTDISKKILSLLDAHSLIPRYLYISNDNKKILIQAGSCNGIDSALIMTEKENLSIYKIEFKEPAAKTSEPDLPKYKEDGKLIITDEFKQKYPQFIEMLEQHLGKNIFDYIGSNIHNFTVKSINQAVSNNYLYSEKYADVCCTEDKNGYLTMIPIDDIQHWAKVEGEIRPAGRNAYSVWTPKALINFIKQLGGKIENDDVILSKKKLQVRKQRGGNNVISGYKINPIFFVKKQDIKILEENTLKCKFEKIKQLNPTISAKVFFKNLKYDNVRNYYGF